MPRIIAFRLPLIAVAMVLLCRPVSADPLPYEISTDNSVITIFGDRSPIEQLTGKNFDEMMGQFGRALEINDYAVKPISCLAMWQFSNDASGYNVVAADCQVQRDDAPKRTALCTSSLRLVAVDYRGEAKADKRSLLNWAYRTCGSPDVALRTEADTNRRIVRFDVRRT